MPVIRHSVSFLCSRRVAQCTVGTIGRCVVELVRGRRWCHYLDLPLGRVPRLSSARVSAGATATTDKVDAL